MPRGAAEPSQGCRSPPDSTTESGTRTAIPPWNPPGAGASPARPSRPPCHHPDHRSACPRATASAPPHARSSTGAAVPSPAPAHRLRQRTPFRRTLVQSDTPLHPRRFPGIPIPATPFTKGASASFDTLVGAPQPSRRAGTRPGQFSAHLPATDPPHRPRPSAYSPPLPACTTRTRARPIPPPRPESTPAPPRATRPNPECRTSPPHRLPLPFSCPPDPTGPGLLPRDQVPSSHVNAADRALRSGSAFPLTRRSPHETSPSRAAPSRIAGPLTRQISCRVDRRAPASATPTQPRFHDGIPASAPAETLSTANPAGRWRRHAPRTGAAGAVERRMKRHIENPEPARCASTWIET